jgi:hypothetical protein
VSPVTPALDTDVIRIACWNVEHNGLPGHTGGDARRRHLAHEVLRTSTANAPCMRRAQRSACPR